MPKVPLKALLAPSFLDLQVARLGEIEQYPTKVTLPPNEIDALSTYLENPSRNGFWRLVGQWNPDSEVSNYFYQGVGSKVFPDKPSGAAATDLFSFQLQSPEQQSFLNAATRRISTLFEMCRRALILEANPKATVKSDPSNPEWLADIDAKEFSTRFSAAMNLFKTNLYFSDFNPIVRDGPFRLANGVMFVTQGPRDSDRLQVVSMSRQCLADTAEFLSALGSLTGSVIERIFSPDEDLFQPYFLALSAAYENVINDQRIRPQFSRSFEYYSRGDHIHCISTLGLMAEDYLTQVYETYLREPCPKGHTLGQLYDLLHHRVREQTLPAREELKNLDDLYGDINEIQKKSTRGLDGNSTQRALALIRNLITTIRSDRKYFEQRIVELHTRDQRVSVFPLQMRDNLNELIRYRNAASHRTRIPLGNYEALRALYCLTSFVIWWRKTRECTDWAKDQQSLLNEAISRATD